MTRDTFQTANIKSVRNPSHFKHNNLRRPGQVNNTLQNQFSPSVPVENNVSFQTQHSDIHDRDEKQTATLNGVTQIFSHLRAVEDLEPLPLSEAEVILGPGLVVIQSHEQSHPLKTKRYMLWLVFAEMNCLDLDSHCGFIVACGLFICRAHGLLVMYVFIYSLRPICCFILEDSKPHSL